MTTTDVRICIPTLNEEEGIESVVNRFQENGYDAITVIDGGSTDGTQSAAQNAGATVIEQTQTGGKGVAVKEVFEKTTESILVLVDGDGTYNPEHTSRLVEPITEDNYDHVLANRFGELREGAMSPLHKFGNFSINMVFGLLYGQNVGDVLTGFRAITRPAYNELSLQSTGFDIEIELTGRSLRAGHSVCTVPTTYESRDGESNLDAFSDGTRIFYRALKTRF